jgi:hypothetical protein
VLPDVLERFEPRVSRQAVVRKHHVERVAGERALEGRPSGRHGGRQGDSRVEQRLQRKFRVRRLVLEHQDAQGLRGFSLHARSAAPARP